MLFTLVEYFSSHPTKYVEVAKVEECKSTHHFENFFQDIIDVGGEGVILRDPNAPYQGGRSAAYLKHKVIY
jgi:DNA ligase 1